MRTSKKKYIWRNERGIFYIWTTFRHCLSSHGPHRDARPTPTRRDRQATNEKKEKSLVGTYGNPLVRPRTRTELQLFSRLHRMWVVLPAPTINFNNFFVFSVLWTFRSDRYTAIHVRSFQVSRRMIFVSEIKWLVKYPGPNWKCWDPWCSR